VRYSDWIPIDHDDALRLRLVNDGRGWRWCEWKWVRQIPGALDEQSLPAPEARYAWQYFESKNQAAYFFGLLAAKRFSSH
jgi:hypothetical protein